MERQSPDPPQGTITQLPTYSTSKRHGGAVLNQLIRQVRGFSGHIIFQVLPQPLQTGKNAATFYLVHSLKNLIPK